jgi:hypothetical protein
MAQPTAPVDGPSIQVYINGQPQLDDDKFDPNAAWGGIVDYAKSAQEFRGGKVDAATGKTTKIDAALNDLQSLKRDGYNAKQAQHVRDALADGIRRLQHAATTAQRHAQELADAGVSPDSNLLSFASERFAARSNTYRDSLEHFPTDQQGYEKLAGVLNALKDDLKQAALVGAIYTSRDDQKQLREYAASHPATIIPSP